MPSLAAPPCSPARVQFSAALDKDEYRAIENLAWMVKNSKQNVGLRMLDAADSVIRILKSKKPENSPGEPPAQEKEKR